MTGAPRAPSAEALETFVPGPEAPRDARRWIEPLLVEWVDGALVTDILLVVSELVTNAVVHGDGPVRLSVLQQAGCLRVAVTDDGDGDVLPRETDPEATGGRGLLVVSHLALDWGVIARSPVGKTVWVELSTGG